MVNRFRMFCCLAVLRDMLARRLHVIPGKNTLMHPSARALSFSGRMAPRPLEARIKRNPAPVSRLAKSHEPSVHGERAPMDLPSVGARVGNSKQAENRLLDILNHRTHEQAEERDNLSQVTELSSAPHARGAVGAARVRRVIFPSSKWQPLPHVDAIPRRAVWAAGASASSTAVQPSVAQAAPSRPMRTRYRAAEVDSHAVIPVWPSWAGGRVVPVNLQAAGAHDPFVLLAHHKHWFDPRDPLREPFKRVGGALGLPYVDVEGFKMHPHRGFDILTYVLDGSDGFRHRDSMGGAHTYRGGCAQWMRCGAGVTHEEFFETFPDKRSNIELFQIWINLPKSLKMDAPAVRYIGSETANPWMSPVNETALGASTGVAVRDLGGTLTTLQKADAAIEERPAVGLLHAQVEPGALWTPALEPTHSAMLYVRSGVAEVPSADDKFGNDVVRAMALETATFVRDGPDGIIPDRIWIRNARHDEPLDVLLLSGAPLNEPVAIGGPIVMNTEAEIMQAYRELRDGTFLAKSNQWA